MYIYFTAEIFHDFQDIMNPSASELIKKRSPI